jgi:hypothetical protein
MWLPPHNRWTTAHFIAHYEYLGEGRLEKGRGVVTSVGGKSIQFLHDLTARALRAQDVAPFYPVARWPGQGLPALEVTVVSAAAPPTGGRLNDPADLGVAKAARLAGFALETETEPFQAPPPLSPIEREEIHRVCWTAVKTETAK